MVDQFVRTRDIVCLRKVQREFEQFRLTRLVDRASRQAFLLIDQPGTALLPAVASLSTPTQQESGSVVSGQLQPDRVEQFINSRAAWLEIEDKP
jgi:hypothetical protein